LLEPRATTLSDGLVTGSSYCGRTSSGISWCSCCASPEWSSWVENLASTRLPRGRGLCLSPPTKRRALSKTLRPAVEIKDGLILKTRSAKSSFQ
jgi:hypothetical protein